jgi:L-tyrosine isonitrile synthase
MSECKVWPSVGTDSVPFSSSLSFDNQIVYGSSVELTTSGSTARRPAGVRAPETTRETVDPDKVLGSFNIRMFRRAPPSDPEMIRQIIAEAIAARSAIQFVLYWGKGPRGTIERPDVECLDYIVSFARRVRESFEPGAAIKLIFSDTHAELNGHSPASIRQYFADIDAAAAMRGFDTCLLSEVKRAAGIAAVTIDCDIPPDTVDRLIASAKKWYRGHGTAEQGALKYYRMSVVENQAVERVFPRSIFITFNGANLRCLCPVHLPIFYMYTRRRGFCIKPWFIPAAATS